MATLTTLQQAVIEQLGYSELEQECIDTLSDIANYGADCGFTGFTYTSDTNQFYIDNRKAIMQAIHENSQETGVTAQEYVQSFSCLKDEKASTISAVLTGLDDIENAIYVINALAWFALEQVAFELSR